MLDQLGLSFEIVPPPPDTEPPWAQLEEPSRHARRSAEAKAQAVAARRPEAVVLAADTIVVLDDDVMEKPGDEEHAREMLARLSGREHMVVTGVAVCAPGNRMVSGVEATAVRFRELHTDEIAAYVRTGEPLDKAGAYGIQAYGATLVEGVRGCYFNVLGFPVARVLALLRAIGFGYQVPGGLEPVD